MRRLRPQINYSSVVATLALFVALGGTGYAISHLNGKTIRKHSIPGNRLKGNTVGGGEIDESTLGQVGDAARLGGEAPGSFQRFGRDIPSGTTVTGTFGVYDLEQDNTVNTVAYGRDVVSLPAPAATPLTDATVNFSTHDPLLTTDEDTRCNGTPETPTSPPGEVCIYPTTTAAAANSVSGDALDGSRFGFVVRATGDQKPTSSVVQVEGTWAYTAP